MGFSCAYLHTREDAITSDRRAKRTVSQFAAFAAALILAALAGLAGCSRRHSEASEKSPNSAPGAAAFIPDKTVPSPVYASVPATPADDVLTYHNNLARTGVNPHETILTPENVNAGSFGKLFSDPVDGFVYAQPLYLAGVEIPGKGPRNVVYVATESDTVYAFDADKAGPPLWRKSLLAGGTAPTGQDFACGQIVPRVGITSTPVADLATKTIYVEDMVKHGHGEHATYAQQLHALDLGTGAEKLGGPETIAGSVPGKGAGSKNGKIAFDAFLHMDRPGLALSRGVIYIAFGSHCDLGDYHGWVFAYGAQHLRMRGVWNATPNGSQGAIWETGDAPAVDSEGNLYVMTGNGTFDANSGQSDYGDSVVKLGWRGNTLRAFDYFTPYDQEKLNEQDLDLGSGGLLLLPHAAGQLPLAAGAGKSGVIYVMNRNNLGHFNAQGDSQIVQRISGQISGSFSTPAYWNGRVYFGPVSQPIKAFAFSHDRLSGEPISQTPDQFDYPGATPSISSNGNRNGIVWALDTSNYVSGRPAVLHAYDAANLSRELYKSPSSGAGGPGVKFSVPTVAHGHVYFGTQHSLEVYGLVKR